MPASNADTKGTVTDTNNTSWPLHFLVFSFNRGEFLAHCIDSIRRCAPHCAITIHDDNSTDPMTRQVLADLATEITVVQPGTVGAGSKHGGLYDNMQRACAAVDDGTLICTLQDDMQLVRAPQRVELEQWRDLYVSNKHHGFLHPVFMKSSSLKQSDRIIGSRKKAKHDTNVTYDHNKQVYLLDRHQRSAGAWYSDVFMIQAGLLRQHNWQFATRESGNEQHARAYFEQMGYLRNPFVAWLPGAPAWRGKRRTLAMKLAEKTRHCGFYPFALMSAEQNAAFCARDPGQLPVDETFLTLAPVDGHPHKLTRPWFYYPLQDKRGLKLANRIELQLSKLFGR